MPKGVTDPVDTTLLRAAVEASGMTHNEIANRLNWITRRGPDGSRVNKTINRKLISSDLAKRVADAIHADYMEVGL